MSELLEEAKNRHMELELRAGDPGCSVWDAGYAQGYYEAMDLIEKHEKPMGLIDVIGEWENMKKSMATVARHKQCKYCHEPHGDIFDNEGEFGKNKVSVYVEDGALKLYFKGTDVFGDPVLVSDVEPIHYCPMCGRDLSEVEE